MKGFKRLLSVLLAVVMACTTLCVTSFAATTYYASVSINGGTATKYTTIAKAFAAIEELSESDTAVITLLRDTSYTGSLTLSGNVTFDLGGYTLKGTKAAIVGVLALDDGAVAVVKNGTITSKSFYGVIHASEQGTLTLEDLTVNNTDTASSGQATKRSAALLIEDGKGATVTATNCTFTNKNTYATYSAPVASGLSTSNVADCNVTLTNCTISGVVYSLYFTGDDNDATTTIVTVNGTEDKSVSGTLNIATSGVSFTVYDGTYDDENVANYVATGYEIITLGTTSWKVDPIISEITVDASTGGSVDVTVDEEEVTEVAYGETVTITATPETGYEITTLTVTGDVSEDEYTVTTNTDGTYSFTMPAEAVTVTVKFELIDYAITLNTVTNGMATVASTANMNELVSIGTTPNTGYEVDSVTVTKASGGTVTVSKTGISIYSFTMPADDVTVTVTYKAIDYTVTVAETDNGTVTVSKTTANYQDEITITVTPDNDYEVKDVSVDTNYLVVVYLNTDGTYSFTMPAENVTVNVTFKLIDHDVSTTTTSNGSYTTDAETANTGDTVTITTSPDTGYEVDTVTVTGAVSGDSVTVTDNGDGTYSFTMPSEQVSISVTYKMTDYEVAVIETANGEVSVPSDTANYGDTVTITATPEAGYKVGTVTVNGTEISGLTFTMPAEDVEIEVTFVLDDLDLGSETTTEGTVEITGGTTAQLGDTVTFTVSASAGYTVAGATVTYVDASGETQTVTVTDYGDGTYSFTMPAYAVSITPSYNAIIYTTSETESVTVDHGYYTVSSITATVGQTVYIYTYPDTVYRVSSVVVSYVDSYGITQYVTVTAGSNGVYSFTMPASNVAISVIYEQYAPNITGMIYVNEQYHGYFIDGHLVCIEHTVDENGYCTVCKEYIGVAAEETDEEVEVAETEIVEETIEIDEPVEDTDTETEVDETEDLEVSDTDTEPETNPTTGLSLALLPMVIAVAGAAFGKRK